MSTDQQYLNDICIAVNSGHCDESLSNREPGRLVMSRWITLANGITCTYLLCFRNVDMAKNGKNQLDGTYIERRSVNIGRISYIHNQSKTKKLDGTPAERRLSSERNNGGKNGGEERKRKTKAKNYWTG